MNKIILEKEATLFRQNNGLGSNDPIRLKSLLSKLNLITVFKALDDNFSGMALKVTDNKNTSRFILVNSNHNLGKQHFTICHELYHLFIQQEFKSMICKTGQFNTRDKEEYNADVFASILLLPEQGLKSLIPDNETGKDKITLKTILKIEHYYSTSRAALLYRLKELNIITSISYEKYKVNIKSGAIQYGYPIDLYEPGNKNIVLGNYGEIANELYDKGKISETHYYRLLKDLGMNEIELQKLINGEE
jgi:Zn-dependent peptidase ImmA (M78 family)